MRAKEKGRRVGREKVLIKQKMVVTHPLKSVAECNVEDRSTLCKTAPLFSVIIPYFMCLKKGAEIKQKAFYLEKINFQGSG